MTRRSVFIPVMLVSLALLAGCATTEKEEKPHITVTASSTVSVEPDTASFTITAEAVEATTEEARNASSAMISEAVNILGDEFSVTSDEITTDYMNISPYYQWLESGRTLTGQKATQTLSITLKNDIDKAGRVYDRLSVLDGISISSVSYSRSDTSSEEAEAREKAVRNAMTKAEEYAKGADMRVGKVLSISEGTDAYSSSFSNSRLMMAETAAASDGYTSTTYYQGSLSVSAAVTAVFELE